MARIIPLPDCNRGQVLGGDSTIPLLGGVKGWVPFPVPRFHEDKFHEDKGREISVNPVRKFGRGFKPLPHCIFSKLCPFGRRLLSNGVNISRITALPTPYPLPRGDFLNSVLLFPDFSSFVISKPLSI